MARCVYGAPDQKAGAVGALYDIHADTRLNHQFEATGGVCEEECVALLRDFFRARRQEREGTRMTENAQRNREAEVNLLAAAVRLSGRLPPSWGRTR